MTLQIGKCKFHMSNNCQQIHEVDPLIVTFNNLKSSNNKFSLILYYLLSLLNNNHAKSLRYVEIIVDTLILLIHLVSLRLFGFKAEKQILFSKY